MIGIKSPGTYLSAGLLSAFAASLCCITPVIALLAGSSSIAANFSWIEPARPYLIGLSIAVLAFAWYVKLKPAKTTDVDCNCETTKKPSFRQSKTFLGIITLFAILMMTFPLYAKMFYPKPQVQTAAVAVIQETLCFELIKEALLGALKTATKQKGANWSYLVTDGGRENQNRQVHQFLASLTQHKLTMITALKDIQFSNSPIEAIHRILKGRYLRNQKFSSPEELTKFLHLAVKDYNTKRPHCSLNLRTPKEAYFGIPLPFDPKQRMSVAKNDRIQKSKVTTCTACDAANAHKCKQPCWPTSSGQKS